MRELVIRIFLTIVVAAGGILALLPIVWMLSTAFKPPGQVFLVPPQWIPKPFVWANIPQALDFMQAGLVFRNSFTIAILVIAGQLASSTLVGFGFARIPVKGKNILFLFVLSGIVLPYQAVLIPQFILFSKLHWINSYKPLIIPQLAGAPFFIFLARQFFMGIPRELDDAARIDGCGYFRIYSQIVLPLSKPLLGIIAIQSFMDTWNDFLAPLIYLNSSTKYTVALALANFTADYGMTPWNLLMVASLTALLPCIILFFIGQKFFIQGITITGLKG